MSTIYDLFTFTGAAGSSLAGYTDGIGSLAQCAFTSGTAQTTSNGSHYARPAGANSSCWVVSGTPGSAAYVVSAQIAPQATSLSGFSVRLYNRLVSSSTHTGYVLTFGSTTPVFGLRILTNGTVTTPGSSQSYTGDYTPSYAVGDTFTVTLTVTAAASPTITATIAKNGTYLTSLSFTDNSGSPITGAGTAALGFNVGISSPSTPGDTAGILVTNFQVANPEIDPVTLPTTPTVGLVALAAPVPLTPVTLPTTPAVGLVTLAPPVPLTPVTLPTPPAVGLVALSANLPGNLNPVTVSTAPAVGLVALSGSTPTITITSPVAWQVSQRSTATRGAIAITGTFAGGTPTGIEASFNGGPFASIGASLGAGTYSGTLANQAPGQGTLVVRWANNPTVTASVGHVGLGDVYVLAGQSNMVGHGYTEQSYTTPPSGVVACVYPKNGTGWQRVVIDPYDTGSASTAPAAGNQAAWGSSTPNDSGTGNGAYALLVASQIAASQNVPVGLIPAAFSGAGLVNAGSGYPLWPKGAAGLGSPPVSLYQGLLNSVKNSGVNAVKAVLWHQGEADAKNGTTPAAYTQALITLANNFAADLPGQPPTVVASIGSSDTAPAAALDGIRVAIANAIAAGGNILPGPTGYATDLGTDMASSSPYYNASNDNLHFRTNAALADLASRWWAALDALFYGGTDGRGPLVQSATLDTSRTVISVNFTDQTPPVTLSTGIVPGTGFHVEVGGVEVSGVTAGIASGSNTTVTLTLPSPATGPVTVSLGYGNESAGKSVPVDSSPFMLPAEPFYGLVVSPPVVFRREFSMLYGKVGQRQPVDL